MTGNRHLAGPFRAYAREHMRPTRTRITRGTAYLLLYSASWLIGMGSLAMSGPLVKLCFKVLILYTLAHCVIFGCGYFARDHGRGQS